MSNSENNLAQINWTPIVEAKRSFETEGRNQRERCSFWWFFPYSCVLSSPLLKEVMSVQLKL